LRPLIGPTRQLPAARLYLFTNPAPTELVEEVAGIMSQFHPAGAKAMAHALAEADLRDVLPHITVPTLLLYGDADRRAPLPVAEALHAQIPASRLVVMAGVGHESNIEAAEHFTTEVRSFLRASDR
jgi:pimeloyl-ACP methyl ester carboxylesterase